MALALGSADRISTRYLKTEATSDPTSLTTPPHHGASVKEGGL